jgi:hypothetical protein
MFASCILYRLESCVATCVPVRANQCKYCCSAHALRAAVFSFALPSLDLVIPVWKHAIGPQIRKRFNLVKGSTLEQLRNLAAYGMNKDHVDAVFRGEMGHRLYVDKWMKSVAAEEQVAAPNHEQPDGTETTCATRTPESTLVAPT